jgi:hypothetical protein
LRLVHALTCTFDTAPEVATTNNYRNVDTKFLARFIQLGCNLMQNIVVQTKPC